MEIRQLPANEYDKALDLSLDVFIECGRKDFDEEGLETFKNFIYNKQLVNELTFYGAFDGESLIGVIATKNEGKHISLFFIKPLSIKQNRINCSTVKILSAILPAVRLFLITKIPKYF